MNRVLNEKLGELRVQAEGRLPRVRSLNRVIMRVEGLIEDLKKIKSDAYKGEEAAVADWAKNKSKLQRKVDRFFESLDKHLASHTRPRE